jgi:ribosome modulation factor
MKNNFVKISIDAPAYEQLTVLAEGCGLTRSAFIRRLIQQEYEVGYPAGLSGESRTENTATEINNLAETVVKNGKVIPYSELNIAERYLTRWAQQRGFTIDTKKVIRQTIAALTHRELEAWVEQEQTE